MKVFIVNRGEIVSRVASTLKKMGLRSLVAYSPSDAGLPYLKDVDEACPFVFPNPKETFLNINTLIQIAKEKKADAIHPGYGFLSENADFAKACIDAGLLWIGPHPKHIELMGDKAKSRTLCEELKVPLVPKILLSNKNENLPKDFSTPFLVKSPAGGGGKGMKVFYSHNDFLKERESIENLFSKLFNNPSILVETYIEKGRHIEVQVVCDKNGNRFCLTPRDCSIQRRFQKMIEETPPINLSKRVVDELLKVSQKVIDHISYDSVGTLEFLVTPDEKFYFLEMNTRLQVEHGVTEILYGVDLVELQTLSALNKNVSISNNYISNNKHSLQCRLYAEDDNFFPSPGKLERLFIPPWDDVRVELTYNEGATVGPDYDPMVGKLIFKGANRNETISRAVDFLKASVFYPLKTNQNYLVSILSHSDFKNGDFSTTWLEQKSEELKKSFPIPQKIKQSSKLVAEKIELQVEKDEELVFSPMTGNLVSWMVKVGEKVVKGQALAMIEAMKMQHAVTAPVSGVIKNILTPDLKLIQHEQPMCLIKKGEI